ncbi:MAG: Flp family type IVb pilin [Acidiphilium sp.]
MLDTIRTRVGLALAVVDRRAVTAVEYAMIAALIAAAIVAGATQLGSHLVAAYDNAKL